ncbi:MAG TPA: septal ring lytic transglycosylase RlpA family protein, partial [Thalassospira sp.]|nr:septal ring lytic transglycosylase RlpA family protein [Thalassospira sp.]
MPKPRKSAFAHLRAKCHITLAVAAFGVLLAGCAETQLAVHGVKRLGGQSQQPAQIGNYKIG